MSHFIRGFASELEGMNLFKVANPQMPVPGVGGTGQMAPFFAPAAAAPVAALPMHRRNAAPGQRHVLPPVQSPEAQTQQLRSANLQRSVPAPDVSRNALQRVRPQPDPARNALQRVKPPTPPVAIAAK